MSAVRQNLQDFVTESALPRVYKTLDEMIDFMQHKSVIDKIFHVVGSKRDIEQIPSFVQTIGAVVKEEYGPYTEATVQQGWNKTLRHIAYGLKIPFSREIMDDMGSYLSVVRTKKFGNSFFDTKERTAAGIFNNGFSTEQAGDGVSLFNSAHPFVTAGTFSNVLDTPAPLSYASINSMTQVFENATLEEGIKYRVYPKYLLVPSALIDTAVQLTKNMDKPGTANRDINAMAEYYGLTTLPWNYLTSNTAYFMLADKTETGLINFEHTPLSFKNYYDEDRDVDVVKGYMRNSFGAVTAHNIVGTNPV